MALISSPQKDPAIRELEAIIKECEGKGVNEEIARKIKGVVDLIELRENYCQDVSTPHSDALERIQTDTVRFPFKTSYEDGKAAFTYKPTMLSGHIEGKFLQSVISMSGATRVLEVGTFTGYAALACADVLPEHGKVVTLEIDPFMQKLAREFVDQSPHGKKIEIKLGAAKDTMAAMIKEGVQFDIVFIDANKEGYIDYLQAAIDDNLLVPGGTVILDNGLMWGFPYLQGATNNDGLAMRRNNEYLKSRDDLFRVLLPIRDGVWVVRRKCETCKE